MRLLKAPGISGRADDPADGPPDAGIEDEEDVRTAAEPVGAPLVDAEDDLPPEVVRVYLKGRFSGREDGEAGLLSGASPAALQPARRLSWLAFERARMCLSLPTQSGLVRCPIA